MVGAERNHTEQEIILKPLKKPLASLEELTEACLPTLTARLWATCYWPGTMTKGWKIGDYNFMIASVQPDPESSVYVQFWSEPHERVSVEVCSGEWNPGALKYVRQRQRELIESLGFTVGGRAHNFQKQVRIETAAEAETAAREVLGIFFNVFGYRGQWPLELKWHQGERADHDLAYSSVTPEDLAKLAAHLGFDVESHSGCQPVLRLRRGRRLFLACLSGRIPDNNLYSVVILETLITSPREINNATFERINDTLAFAQVSRRGPRELVLSMPLRFDGGVTVKWMANAFQHWLAAWRTCRRLVKSTRTTPPMTVKRRRSTETTIH